MIEREREPFPSLFHMTIETQAQAIEHMVEALMANDPGIFLVDAKTLPGNNIKIFLDGETGISIEKCVAYNRALYKKIEESGMFPNGDFSLEVSSPGLDEPLKLLRQYKKNIGRKVEVLLKDGIKKEGKLQEVLDDKIVLEEEKGKNKKKELIRHEIAFDSIKSTKIQIVF